MHNQYQIKMKEDKLELSGQTKKDMKKSREEYKKGKVYSLEEVKKKLKL